MATMRQRPLTKYIKGFRRIFMPNPPEDKPSYTSPYPLDTRPPPKYNRQTEAYLMLISELNKICGDDSTIREVRLLINRAIHNSIKVWL